MYKYLQNTILIHVKSIFLFQIPWKHQKNLWFSYVTRGLDTEVLVGCTGLKRLLDRSTKAELKGILLQDTFVEYSLWY